MTRYSQRLPVAPYERCNHLPHTPCQIKNLVTVETSSLDDTSSPKPSGVRPARAVNGYCFLSSVASFATPGFAPPAGVVVTRCIMLSRCYRDYR